MSEFCSWKIPIFFKCYVIFAKSAFAWEQIRAILEKRGLNSSLKVFILKFIPLCLMQTFLLSLPCSQCTAVQSLHCIGLFPSTCALEPVRLSDSSLQLSLKSTPTRYALTYTLSRAVTFFLGGAPSYYLFSENERILLWEEFNPTPAVALDFHIEKHAWRRIAQRTLASLIFEHSKKKQQKKPPNTKQLSWQTRFNPLWIRQITWQII